MMKRLFALGIVLAFGVSGLPAVASGIDSSASVVGKPDGSAFDYSLTLNNSASSTDSIGTLWFAWVPGADFLPTAPSNILAPEGWTAAVTNEGPKDGFAIQYVASSAAFDLSPGKSLSGFGFTSLDTPAQLQGNSPFFPTIPTTTSFVYQGGPLVGDSAQFLASVSTAPSKAPVTTVSEAQASTVPEPSSLLIGVFVMTASCTYMRMKRTDAFNSPVTGRWPPRRQPKWGRLVPAPCERPPFSFRRPKGSRRRAGFYII